MGAWLAGVMPRIVAPFAPHLAEELWEKVGGKQSIFKSQWPAYDEAACQEDMVNIPVQIKGKLRGVIVAPKGISKDEALKLALLESSVERHIADVSAIRKVIFVPDKILNLIV